MNRSLLVFVFSALLLGCAQQPQKPADAVSEASAPEVAPVEPTPELPRIELTDELLYEYLLIEIAAQRGYNDLAAQGAADLTDKTGDPRLARRAAQLAFESGDMTKSLHALRMWQEIEPDNQVVRRMLASVLLRGGKYDEAKSELAAMLAAEPDQSARGWVQVYQLLAASPDKALALRLMQALTAAHPAVAETHWALAQLARSADQPVLAMQEIREARRLRPDWDAAASFEAQLLMVNSPEAGLSLLRGYVSQHPQAIEIRLQYARALLDQKQYEPAREAFRALSREKPDSAEFALAVALVSLQLNDLKAAEQELLALLDKDGPASDAVQFYLGQLYEAKSDQQAALTRYRAVASGDYVFPARLRAAQLLKQSGDLAGAREVLQHTEVQDNRQRVQLLVVEAQLLRDAGRDADALQVLEKGLDKLPNHPDLLYETAMQADRMGRFAQSEKWLRQLIRIQPAHAHAYNALGYSLLERKERIPEALQLVEKALQLAPNDPAIMDSVGWGYYRSGRLEEGIAMLRRALAANPDGEIAAHLGEVLWVRGDREEARKVWRESLKVHPNHAQLQAVMRKFDAP
ncbi:MAG: tetratricopeptide repeat protein [Gallionella sp.]|jgi:tetratricopeptide (TPR) repeat protein|nr:tetratricopeptide repeat protein [Gallionella sp.]